VDLVEALGLVDGEGGAVQRTSGSSRLREDYGAAGWSRLGPVFFLAVGRRGLNVAGRPALGLERGTFSVLNLWPIQCWWVRSGGMKGKARSSTI
jgi:hypothetical protein